MHTNKKDRPKPVFFVLQSEDPLGVAPDDLFVGLLPESSGGAHLVEPRSQREYHILIHHVRGEEEPVGVCLQKGQAEVRVALK